MDDMCRSPHASGQLAAPLPKTVFDIAGPAGRLPKQLGL